MIVKHDIMHLTRRFPASVNLVDDLTAYCTNKWHHINESLLFEFNAFPALLVLQRVGMHYFKAKQIDMMVSVARELFEIEDKFGMFEQGFEAPNTLIKRIVQDVDGSVHWTSIRPRSMLDS